MTDSYDTQHPAGHEPDTTSARGVTITALVLAASVAVIIVAILQFERRFEPIAERRRVATPAPATAEETTRVLHWQGPTADLARVRKLETERLQGYAWMDRDAGLVRIPITRAMALVAERAAASGDEQAVSPRRTPQEGGEPSP